MKKFKSLLSIVLSTVLLLCCLPLTGLSISAEETDEIYTIYMADPSVYGAAGTDVTAVSSKGLKSNQTVYSAEDSDGYYYTFTQNYTADKSIYGGVSYAKSGKSNSTAGTNDYGTAWDLKWIGTPAVLNALAGLVEVSVDYRITQSGAAVRNVDIYVGGAHTWTTDDTFASQWLKTSATEFGVWKTVTSTPESISNFYSGYLGFKADLGQNDTEKVLEDVTVVSDFRNIKLTVKESDRLAINTALEGTDYTFDKLIAPFLFKGEDHVMFKANPTKAGTIGTDISVSIADGAKASRGPVYVASDDDGAYFSYSDTYKSGDWIYNRSYFFKSGYDNNTLGWMGDGALSALAGKVTVSLKWRITATGAPSTEKFSIYMTPTNAKMDYETTKTSLVSGSTTAQGEWNEINVTPTAAITGFYSGYFAVKVEPTSSFDGTLTVDIRDITFTVNEDDREEIDTLLADTAWTFETLTEPFADSGLDNPYETDYSTDVIWYANPDRVDGNVGSDITAEKPSDSELLYNTNYRNVKCYDEDGVYYRTTMQVSGSGGDEASTILQSGIIYDSNIQMQGWGWLNNLDVMNAIAPYMYVGFEYRFDGTVPDGNPMLYVTGINGYNYVWKAGTKITQSGQWSEYSLKAIQPKTVTGANSTEFGDEWYNTKVAINLYVYEQSFSGIQKIDIRNLRIELKAAERIYINKALSEVEGIDEIEGFTKGVELGVDANGYKDYYSLLVAPAAGEKFDVDDDGEVTVKDLVRLKKYTAEILGYLPEMMIERSDDDGDGWIDAIDISALRKKLIGA